MCSHLGCKWRGKQGGKNSRHMWQSLIAKEAAGSSSGGRPQADHRSQSWSCKYCQSLTVAATLANLVPSPHTAHMVDTARFASFLGTQSGVALAQDVWQNPGPILSQRRTRGQDFSRYMMLQLVPAQLKIRPCLDSGTDLVVVREERGV